VSVTIVRAPDSIDPTGSPAARSRYGFEPQQVDYCMAKSDIPRCDDAPLPSHLLADSDMGQKNKNILNLSSADY
jgi:hypothetical protein